MNFKSHAQTLAEFIQKYSSIWKKEIMNEYPETIDDYPIEWINLLDSLSPQELYDVDCKCDVPKIHGTSFHEFMQEIQSLSQVESIPDSPEVPLEDWAFQGVKKKKRHEIQKIVPVLKKVKADTGFEYVIDIGGGVGHLSRILSHYHSIASISIDQNTEFQKIGLNRLQKYRRLEGAADVTFMNLTFGLDTDEENLKLVFNKKALGLGLHTCGPLANTLIKASADYKTQGLLSFGCCYHQLTPQKDFPISGFYKTEQLPVLNLYGFTLATRSHAGMDFDSYMTKMKVKSYRYALHLFIMKHFNSNQYTSVGECHMSLYTKPFHHYIKEKLAELGLLHSFTDEYFNQYFESAEIQRQLRVMFLCNIIRWQMGRVLEIYLLVDRCVYLEEQGYKVDLQQYFDENLSPRNLGILALHK